MAFTVSAADNNVVAIIDKKIDSKAKCAVRTHRSQ